MRKSSTLLLALLLTATIPFASQAQGVILGAHGGYDPDASEVLLGASVGLSLPGVPLVLTPGFDFYPSITGGSFYIVDFDANYAIPAGPGISPYVGAGVFLAHTSFDLEALGSFSGNDVGFNLNGGAAFSGKCGAIVKPEDQRLADRFSRRCRHSTRCGSRDRNSRQGAGRGCCGCDMRVAGTRPSFR